MKQLRICSSFISVLSLFAIGCSTGQIIEKKEYDPVVAGLKLESPSLAARKFPKKESKHFIPLVEKVYLQLIDEADVITKDSKDTNEFKALLKQSREIIQNEKTSISNELGQLFFIQTDEGYYPANHEIFWMHLMLGLTFVKKDQIANARVEAKRISELFSRVDMSGKPFYDNPEIRILSAVLWVLCGEKENALVDIRKAQEMGGLKGMGKYDDKKIEWNLVLKGTGLVAFTDANSFADKVRGFNAIRFKSENEFDPYAVENERSGRFIFSTKSWHSENLVRNEAFKSTIQKSKYMSRMFSSEVEYQSLNLLTSAATGVVLVTGIAVGVAIVGGGIYLATQTTGNSEAIGQIIGLGLIAGTEIFNGGINFYSSTQNKIQTERRDFQDVSRFYRYVRFIPDYLVLDTIPQKDLLKSTIFLTRDNLAGKIQLVFQP